MAEVEDADALVAALTPWFAARLADGDAAADGVEIRDLRTPDGTGFSSETYVYTLTWDGGTEEQVLRTRPTGTTVFRTYDLEQQFRCMDLLADSPVPVPAVRWHEPDDGIIGQPFYVMEKVEGVIPPDAPPYTLLGWVVDAPPEDQAAIWSSSVTTLATLHTLDPAPFAFLDRPAFGATGLEQQLGEWTDLLQWGRAERPQPTLEAALEWLRACAPTTQPDPVVNWGDARISNTVYRDHRPVALLDWEMAALGPPEVDLGWFLYMDHQLSVGVGAERLPGFLSRDDTVALYEQTLGRSVRDLEWYEVFAGFRFAITMMRIARRVIDDGHLPEDSDVDRNHLGTRYLATILDLPAPGEPGPLG